MPSSQHARVALLELADRGPESVIAAAHELPDVGEDGIGLGELAAEIGQLLVEQCRLQGVEPRIVAPGAAIIPAPKAVIALHPQRVGELPVRGGDNPRVAAGRQVLERMEAEATRRPEAADRLTVEGGPDGLGGVLHDMKTVALGNGADPLHVSGPPREMDRHDGTGAGRHRGGYLLGVEIEIIAYGGKDRPRSRERDGSGARKERVGRRDHFVARSDPEGAEGKKKRVGTVRHADRERYTA